MTEPRSAPSLTLKRPAPQRRRVGSTFLKVAGAVALLVLLGAGWRYGWPHAIATWTVEPGTLDVAITGPATLDAINKASVSSRISGRLTEILVDRNDVVVPGQVVAIIEQDDLQGVASASRASLEVARAAEREAEASLASGQATLANAQANFNRLSELRKGGWVSQSGFDQAQATLRESEARVAALRQSVERSEAQADAAASGLRVDEAQLGLATVRAPFAGVVAVRNRNVGDVLSPGAPILEIVDPESIVLTARFDESAIGAVMPGQAAQISFAFSPDRPFAASVLRLSRQVDPETREFTVDVVPARLPNIWALDQRANVRIILARRSDVLTVPASFVTRRGGRTGVWVIRHGRARWKDVDFDESHGDRVEVRQGLAAGDILLAPENAYPLMPVASPAKDRR